MILENIQNFCERKKMTTYELEQKLGFGRGTIKKWNKSSPTVEKLQAVADYFHVSVNRLLRKEG